MMIVPRNLNFILQVIILGLLAPIAGLAEASGDSGCESCRMILLDPGSGESNAIDLKIAETQRRVKSDPGNAAQIERLGWLFVQKARLDNDPGFYKLAEQCALCLQSIDSNSMPALLLKGHVLHSLHHFKEAEPLALQLTAKRGLAFDFGLLGDIEYDQGKISAAAAAYQKMVDLRPDLQSYSRVAQLRWITGDLPGAAEAMALAADAGSPLNAEPTAWTYSRLALLKLQSGDIAGAERSALIALRMQTNNAAALAALGRIQLARGETNSAVASLAESVALSPLPEPQWLLADSLRSEGKISEAARVETALQNRGVSEDPRSFSLYLSTRNLQPKLALQLAERELQTRQDVFTHDAVAWALKANGRLPEARAEMTNALAEGTQDARLFFHAAMISDAAGDKAGASCYALRAGKIKQMLFPSELQLLESLSKPLDSTQQSVSNVRQQN